MPVQEIIEQRIVLDPRRAELMKKGADPLSDAWCGNKGMTPNMVCFQRCTIYWLGCLSK